MSLFEKWFNRNWSEYSFKKYSKDWGQRMVGKKENTFRNNRIVLIWDLSNKKATVSDFAAFLEDFDKFFGQYDREWEIDGGYFITYSEYDKSAFNVLYKGMADDLRDLVEIKVMEDKNSVKKPETKQSQVSQNVEFQNPKSGNIFIIHGRDKAPAFELKILLDNELDLKSSLLQDQPNSGRTLIEKLEKYSTVDYAFIIITPDDFGGLKNESNRDRARQNVILELGHFMSKGRDKTCVLLKGDVELPSDINGICYLKFSDSVEEVFLKIKRELSNAHII